LVLLIALGGSATLAAMLVLAITQAPLGSILFFSCTAVPCVVYGLLLRRLMGGARMDGSRRLLLAALLLAVAFRVPLAAGWVGTRSDMVRYRWDGRVQTLGINPFLVVPDQSAVAWTHTDDTRLMPSIHDRTPYPAAAQLFFRGIVSVADSSRLMKAALVVCDLLTMVVLLAWLRDTRRSPWLVLVYAWNPLVILEIAHSGHIDALGSLWIAVSAWMLSTNRGMRAAIAFVIAVAVKLLPIVLIPLYWKRMRVRDGVVAALVLVVLYLPFASAGTLPLGAVPNVIEYVRFNGPAFKHLALLMSPKVAAMIAVLAGLAVAAWMRRRYEADEPAAWAWPMAVALAGAPVVYPWYLLYFTPFLFTRRALPLVVWTISVLPVYIVWELAYRHGHRWRVPEAVMWIEYAAVLTVLIVPAVLKRSNSFAGKSV
jgi:alpha-1,6-mannosyltransferase